jgi:alpha-L-fucosidase
LGSKKEDFPWQSPATVSHSWGFHSTDSEWKSTTALLKSLINNVSLNGNFMLNIGPRANGEVPFEISQRMLEMGEWLKINGESIYGAQAFDLKNNLHDWGKITYKETDEIFKIYLHVFNWPLNKTLNLTGITDNPEKIYLLSDKQKSPLSFIHSGSFTKIDLPQLHADPFVSVIAVEFNKKPKTEDGLVAKTTDNGYLLLPVNQNLENNKLNIEKSSQFGTVPEHVIINSQRVFKWKIYIDKPGEKSFDVSYSFQNESTKTRLKLKAAGTELSHSVKDTGKTVGEPNQDWVIDNFKSNYLGKINFTQVGVFDIELEVQPQENDEIKFQWVWIN